MPTECGTLELPRKGVATVDCFRSAESQPESQPLAQSQAQPESLARSAQPDCECSLHSLECLCSLSLSLTLSSLSVSLNYGVCSVYLLLVNSRATIQPSLSFYLTCFILEAFCPTYSSENAESHDVSLSTLRSSLVSLSV